MVHHTQRMCLIHWLLSTTLMLFTALPVRAQEPLCGVHSLYTAARILGLEPDLGVLLKPEFVGSEDGSSIAELERAAATIGLHYVGVKNLKIHDLEQVRWPVILHVKTDLSSNSFEHFVLFAGLQEGRAKIFDGTNDVAKWSLADVASRWDGKALVLSTSAVHVKELGAPSRRQRRNWSVAIAGAIGILCATQSQIRGSRLGAVGTSAIGIVILIATAGYAAWVFHAKTPTGFIACPGTVDAVRAANASTFLPNINVAAVQSLLKSGDAIFIDARSAENFSEGHLPGALNLQGFLPPRAARQIADLIPKGRRLVVYCANAKCPLSKATAQRLIEAGHDDVVIYPGGWNEWRDRAGTTADARQP